MFVAIILPLVLAIGLGVLIGAQERDASAGIFSTILFIIMFGLIGTVLSVGICGIKEGLYKYDNPVKSSSAEIVCEPTADKMDREEYQIGICSRKQKICSYQLFYK